MIVLSKLVVVKEKSERLCYLLSAIIEEDQAVGVDL